MPPIIITADNRHTHQREAYRRASHTRRGCYTGCLQTPPGYARPACVSQWPAEWPIIPRDQWHALIEKGQGTFLSDYRKGKLPPHNQQRTSRCWVHGSVRAVEVLHVFSGRPPLLLSPDSVAYPIEGTRDRGGYPLDACRQLAAGGACPLSMWPETDLSPRNADPDWHTAAKLNRLLRWIEVKTFEQQFTCAIRRIPVAIGLGWWGHLVCQLDPVILPDGTIGTGCDNSWGPDYGDNGYFQMDEEHSTADIGAWAPIASDYWPLANAT